VPRVRALLRKSLLGIFLLSLVSCASGRRWVNEPLVEDDYKGVRLAADERPSGPQLGVRPGRIGGPAPGARGDLEASDAPGSRPLLSLESDSAAPENVPPDAVLLGVYRNTYYDFPAEADFSGAKVSLMNRSCQAIRSVPRRFFEALCVQGSGTLTSGVTVSFGKRDCSCAETCPKTGQKICFDSLDPVQFPWGRGALGKPITPLLSVAVDSSLIPLGTHLYIAEFDGIPRTKDGARHDGCFIAEDRGMNVVGEHVDIFAGNPTVTAHLNALVPSNRGVHVYTKTARCE
jgi:hypothetical protein